MSLCCEAKNCTQCSRWGCTNAEYTGTITYFGWLAILCLMHPMIPLAFLVTKTLTCTLPSPKTTRSLSAGLCSSPLSWNVYVYPGLHSSGRRYFQSFFFFSFFPSSFFFFPVGLLKASVCSDLLAWLLMNLSSSFQSKRVELTNAYQWSCLDKEKWLRRCSPEK